MHIEVVSISNNVLKFALIGICLLIALLSRKDALSRRDWVFLLCALLFTLGADFFLLVHRNYPLGVTVFWGAHIFYSLRFGTKNTWKFFFLALPLPVILLIVSGNLLLAAASVYAVLFIISYTSMVFAVKRKKYPQTNSVLIFAGMTLFVLCDIFVVIFNLGMMGFASFAVTEFAVDAIWLFYAPAKLCLAFSAMKFETKSATLLNHNV